MTWRRASGRARARRERDTTNASPAARCTACHGVRSHPVLHRQDLARPPPASEVRKGHGKLCSRPHMANAAEITNFMLTPLHSRSACRMGSGCRQIQTRNGGCRSIPFGITPQHTTETYLNSKDCGRPIRTACRIAHRMPFAKSLSRIKRQPAAIAAPWSSD